MRVLLASQDKKRIEEYEYDLLKSIEPTGPFLLVTVYPESESAASPTIVNYTLCRSKRGRDFGFRVRKYVLAGLSVGGAVFVVLRNSRFNCVVVDTDSGFVGTGQLIEWIRSFPKQKETLLSVINGGARCELDAVLQIEQCPVFQESAPMVEFIARASHSL